MHFDARVCGFCRPLTLLCWHDVSDIFSYYRLFVDDLIDTLGLKLYIYKELTPLAPAGGPLHGARCAAASELSLKLVLYFSYMYQLVHVHMMDM